MMRCKLSIQDSEKTMPIESGDSCMALPSGYINVVALSAACGWEWGDWPQLVTVTVRFSDAWR